MLGAAYISEGNLACGTSKMEMDKIAKVVKATLAADFGKVKILKVKVEKALDSDGQEILRIYVIFEGESKDLDAGAVSGAVRHIRPKLSKMGFDEFPLFSFIADSDVGAGKLASA
jgi:hypothetical protein